MDGWVGGTARKLARFVGEEMKAEFIVEIVVKLILALTASYLLSMAFQIELLRGISFVFGVAIAKAAFSKWGV